MKRDYQVWRSPSLERHMELLVFGEGGMPVIVFPTSMGRFYQWEDFGLVGHLAPRIDSGWIQLWCVDSVDGESFYDRRRSPQDRARRHFDYERYLVDEVVPRIAEVNPRDFRCLLGASFGAFHAALLALRRPEVARKVVCLSGAYDAARWLDGAGDGDCYFVNPLAFLPDLDEPRYLDPLRRVEFEIVTGEEDANVDESRRIAALLQRKGVPARLHVWEGWAHDWPYWQQMVDLYV